jgi:NarL family two-component system response regulator LiaR
MVHDERRISVLIVDDHIVVRQGLRSFLELHDDIDVAGEAADGEEAVALARALEPDVILMDLVMPRLDGIGAIRRIKALGSHTRIIALTSFAEDDKLFPAIQAGAASYLLKDVTPDDLVEAIRAVHRGEARLHPDVMRRLMDQVTQEAGSRAPTPAGAELTERELEVVRLVAEGLNNREIAGRLVLSEKTVKTHISNILGKLALEGRTQLAIYAIRHGLAQPGGAGQEG